MASNQNGNAASTTTTTTTENSLERIKRQLASGSGRNLLQGPLLKRSETLHKWNERWMILDPTTGKMEYKTRRNEPTIKGTIIFDANSTIAISPVNFNGLPKYDGCCFCILFTLCITYLYISFQPFLHLPISLIFTSIDIGTPQRKDYFLCAETPGAARAWVQTLQASQLVIRAHKEAVNSLSGAGSAKLGTVAAVVAAANSTALECSKEIEAAMQISLRNALGMATSRVTDAPMDDLTIMKKEAAADKDKQELLAYVRMLESQLQRQQIDTKQMFEKTESLDIGSSLPLTKHVDMSDENVDKACLNDGENVVHITTDQVNLRPAGDEGAWSDIQATEVREISPQTEARGVDIPVIDPSMVENHQDQEGP
ncbi:hypothetical protein ACFE04_002862 [Oxalis oulophora]